MAVIELLAAADTAGEQVAVPPGWYEVEAVGVPSSGVKVQSLAQDEATWVDTGVSFSADGVDDLVVPSGTLGLRAAAVTDPLVAGATVSLKSVRGIGG